MTSKVTDNEWTQISDGAWVNADRTLAIARAECGTFIMLNKEGKLVSVLEDAPTCSIGSSGSVSGTGNISLFDPLLKGKKRTMLRRFKTFVDKKPTSKG